MTHDEPMRPKQASVLAAQILDAIERVVVGKRDSLALILTAILSGGHVLIEDLPGVGKR